MNFNIGERVIFGRGSGQQTAGVVVGTARGGKYRVRQDEARGKYPVGSVWTVPADLMHPANGSSQVSLGHSPPVVTPSFVVGDRVVFDAGRKGRIEGTVSKVNRATISLVDTSDGHPLGWRVNPAMLTKIGTAALPAAPSSKYRVGNLVRTEALFGSNRADLGERGYDVHTVTWVGHEPGRGSVVELDGWRRAQEDTILGLHDVQRRPFEEVIQGIRGAYSQLSPECLWADGERSRGAAAQLAAGLNRWLRLLFREAGREVSEDEAYATTAGKD